MTPSRVRSRSRGPAMSESRLSPQSWENEKRFQAFVELVRNLAGDISHQEKANLTNSLFQRTAETDLLTEIMDIKDELNTILQVFIPDDR